MTSDDLISMHMATERVLQDMALLDHFPHGDAHLIDVHLAKLREGVQTLATIQRDLLKAMLQPRPTQQKLPEGPPF